MIFRNPWAWVGLIAIAGPLLAHLLARRQARRQPFPNLRFLPGAIERPISLDRPTNVYLLLLRVSIVGLAVAALAQPLWLSSARVERLSDEIARAIIVDSSASVELGRARAEAARLQADATAARVVETRNPAALIPGALQWLATEPMRRELIVVSDFQMGTLARTNLDQVPAHVGLQMLPVGNAAAPVTPPQLRNSITLLAGSNELAAAEAARVAATARGAPAQALFGVPVAIVFPGYERRETLLKTSREIDQPWMFEALADIADDGLVREAAARIRKPFAELVSGVTGKVDDLDMLILVTREPAHSVFSAALISSVARVSDTRRSAAETRVTRIPAEELRSWNRPASPSAPTRDQVRPGESHGRWLWVGVLVLLAVETIVRRRRRDQTVRRDNAIAA